MRPRSPYRNGGVLCVVLTAMGVLSACSGGDTADRPAAAAAAPACSTPADSILGLATRKFVAQVDPKPHRFLIPVSDSALPASAHWALQATGATLNFYPRDTTAQKQAVRQLAANGSYTLLLIKFHGQRALTDGRTAVEFSGNYLSGAASGKAIPRTSVLFSCQAAGERFVVETPVSGT